MQLTRRLPRTIRLLSKILLTHRGELIPVGWTNGLVSDTGAPNSEIPKTFGKTTPSHVSISKINDTCLGIVQWTLMQSNKVATLGLLAHQKAPIFL